MKIVLVLFFSFLCYAASGQQPGLYSLDTSTWANLKPVFREKEVVGLGESTHGTAEFYRERYSISKFLIENCGYRSVILEADFASLLPLNDYVHTGAGNPDIILKQAGSWMFYTKPMGEFVRWIRQFNTTRPAGEQVYLFGMDIFTVPVTPDSIDKWQPLRELNTNYALNRNNSSAGYRDSCMAENVLAICRLTKTKAIVWAHNLHISRGDQQVGYPSLVNRLGERLRGVLQDEYCAVGMFFNSGSFMVMHRESRDGKTFFPYLTTETVKSSREYPFTRELARRYPDGFFFMGPGVKSNQLKEFYKPQRIYTAGSYIVPGTSEIMLRPFAAFSAILFVPESTPLVQMDEAIRSTRP
ncbi:MAG: hypothetical protein EOO09_20980 [Chitinophagaceae bacterium]|nr:MAG: hypothetical protein EOO09_20980 [Chitinophagaceae bacterium]